MAHNPFKSAMKLIKDLVVRLMAEAAEEAEHEVIIELEGLHSSNGVCDEGGSVSGAEVMMEMLSAGSDAELAVIAGNENAANKVRELEKAAYVTGAAGHPGVHHPGRQRH
jgi:hypothetical protein